MSERRFGVRVRVSWERFRDLGMAMVVVVTLEFLYRVKEETRQQRPTTSTDHLTVFSE